MKKSKIDFGEPAGLLPQDRDKYGFLAGMPYWDFNTVMKRLKAQREK